MIQSFFGPKVAAGRKTVASVLTAFNKTLDDLKEVELQNEAEAARQAQIVVEATAAHNAAIDEAVAAREVAEKLTNLVSPVISTLSIEELKKECA
jgi:hypothetical protein